MKLTILTLTTCALFLNGGCSLFQKPEVVVVPDDQPLFCDVEDPRRFTQAELDERAAKYPANLRRDFKTNTAWDRWCANEPETVTAG